MPYIVRKTRTLDKYTYLSEVIVFGISESGVRMARGWLAFTVAAVRDLELVCHARRSCSNIIMAPKSTFETAEKFKSIFNEEMFTPLGNEMRGVQNR